MQRNEHTNMFSLVPKHLGVTLEPLKSLECSGCTTFHSCIVMRFVPLGQQWGRVDSSGGSQYKLYSQENWEVILFPYNLQGQDFSCPGLSKWLATAATCFCPLLWPQAQWSPSVPTFWPHFFFFVSFRGLRDLGSSTRDRTWALISESVGS